MRFHKIFRGRALYTEKNRIWVARGMSFWAIDYSGKRVTEKFTVGGIKEKIFSYSRLTRQILREGLHHLLPLPDGNILVTAKRKTYTVSKKGEILNIFTGYRGNKPAHQGICVTLDGTIFFGEYTLNINREHDTNLYRSTDGGLSFSCVLTLPKDRVRHIHFVKYDPYENCIWLGTGDKDFECILMRSSDNGDTWEIVGEGSQNWRAIGVCFTSDYLVWGTDAGTVPDQNYIIRMNKKTHKLEFLAEAEGPCHGCGVTSDGRVFISTGVEGGENEKDCFARLKMVSVNSVEDVYRLKKDPFPMLLQYGVLRMPLGIENTNRIIFTAMGLSQNGECVIAEK